MQRNALHLLKFPSFCLTCMRQQTQSGHLGTLLPILYANADGSQGNGERRGSSSLLSEEVALLCAFDVCSCVCSKKDSPHLRRGKDLVQMVCRYQPTQISEVVNTQAIASEVSKVMGLTEDGEHHVQCTST